MTEKEGAQNMADFLDEEAEEDAQVLHDLLHKQSSLSSTSGLVHSATTDTLDSVYLEPPNPETSSLTDTSDNDLAMNQPFQHSDDQAIAESVQPESADMTAHVVDLLEVEAPDDTIKEVASFSIEGDTKEITATESAPSLSKYFGGGKDDTADPFASDFFSNIQEPEENILLDLPKVGTDSSSIEGKLEDAANEMIDLTLNDTNEFLDFEVNEPTTNINGNNINNKIVPDDLKVESVDFDLSLDKTDTVETPVNIEEKDTFESFTAELADTEALDALGMSPAAPSFMTEKNITDYFRQTSSQSSDGLFNNINRQISQTSAKSTSSQDRNVVDIEEMRECDADGLQDLCSPTPVESADVAIPTPDLVSQSYQITETETTPKHQPMFPPSTTLSPVDSPVHQPFTRQTSIPISEHSNTEQRLSAFQAFSDSGAGDDPFSVTLQMSDSDRQHDAWLPSEATKNILITMATHAPGTYAPDRELLCSPSLVISQPQGDPVRDLVYRYMGEQEALKRKVLTADTVSCDVQGLQNLMKYGCYRAAIDLTMRLLTEAGQASWSEAPTAHSPETLQLWHCRFSLMTKLRMYNVVESESVAFKNLDSPDLYYGFYPQQYQGKRGSMVPFGMRLLHAELPHHLGRSTETLDRYYYILAITQKIQKNLSDGLSEDGSALTISAESRKVSQTLWQGREKTVYYLIANVLVLVRDYDAALSVYEILLEKDENNKKALLSGLGRIHLQIGNLNKASEYFQLVQTDSDSDETSVIVTNYMNNGFEAMCQNNFLEAYSSFKLAVNADPTNTSAVNNMSVCCLYLGKLKEALTSLEALVHADPDKNLHEGILFNLCTLYELESSRALHKKQALLDLVSKHKGDGFPVVCLKMT